jgi:endonuclease/exonuclease/phosphatase family metal-dependent hydrolase
MKLTLRNLILSTAFLLASPAYAESIAKITGVRLMTLNVAHARAQGFSQILQSTEQARSNLLDIAEIITREKPDIVAFQEIDSNSVWNGRFNHGQFLADKTEYDHWFTGSHQLSESLDYGTGLMSKFNLTNPRSISFKKPFARPKKGFVLSTVDWPELENVQVDLVSIHLDFLSHAERRREMNTLRSTLETRKNLRIIMGDFNMEYKERHALLPNLAKVLDLHVWNPDGEELVTFPTMGKRLDWVLVSREFNIISHQVLEDPVSDHQPVIVEVTLLDNKAQDTAQLGGSFANEAD